MLSLYFISFFFTERYQYVTKAGTVKPYIDNRKYLQEVTILTFNKIHAWMILKWRVLCYIVSLRFIHVYI